MQKIIFYLLKIALILGGFHYLVHLGYSYFTSNLNLGEDLYNSIIFGVLTAFLLLVFHMFNLRSVGLTLFDENALTQNPTLIVPSVLDTDEIVMKVRRTKKYKIFSADDNQIKVRYQEPFHLGSNLIVLTKGNENWKMASSPSTKNIVFDLGSNIKGLYQLKNLVF